MVGRFQGRAWLLPEPRPRLLMMRILVMMTLHRSASERPSVAGWFVKHRFVSILTF